MNDIHVLEQMWFGLIASSIIVFNLILWSVHLLRTPKHVEASDHRVAVRFEDGSVAMVDPNNPQEVSAVAELGQSTQEAEPQHAFYSPGGGMPARNISEYDFSKEDYEVKTAGPVREDLYD
jgi:hypothetical protein